MIPSNKKNILQNERTYRDGIPKKQPNKVGMVPQYPYGLSSLYRLTFSQQRLMGACCMGHRMSDTNGLFIAKMFGLQNFCLL